MIALIDRAARAGQTEADRRYLVASLAYGNVALEDPRMPAFRLHQPNEPRNR